MHESFDSRVPEPRKALMQSGWERAKTATIPAGGGAVFQGATFRGPRAQWAVKWNSASGTITKLGGAGDRIAGYLCMDCANLPCLSGSNQFTDTKFTRPIAKISESNKHVTERAGERLGQSKSMVTNDGAKLKPVL